MGNKTIVKCKICEEPFWEYIEKREGCNGICRDCIAKADAKEMQQMNKPPQF
jgi:hypothetical protein